MTTRAARPPAISPPARPFLAGPTPPVLIEVPALRGRTARKPARRGDAGVRRRRRRLRREVRWGGAMLGIAAIAATLLAAPAGVLGWGRPGEGTVAPVVRLSPLLEPEPVAAGLEPEAPRVRPAGYLLPAVAAETSEDAADAGR